MKHTTAWEWPEEHVASVKVADKLHDFLMSPKSRPDLQTPEGQRFLQLLKERYHNERTDPLMPWLTREWKKDRIRHYLHPSDPGGDGLRVRGEPRQMFDQEHEIWDPLWPGTVNHWADFYHSNHPLRQEMGDIMKHQVPAFHQRVQDWDQAMKEQAHEEGLQGGKVVHTTPDNWTVRQLQTPEELKAEGDAMGHCVGGYHSLVDSGRTSIYSLRDPKGTPHATTEINPNQYEWTDSFGKTHRSDIPSTMDDPQWVEKLLTGNPNNPERLNTATLGSIQNTGVRNGLRNYHREKAEFSEGMRNKYSPESLDYQDLYNELHTKHGTTSSTPVPHGGDLVQIQGKANQEPLPEYKQQLADWFRSFPPEDRPKWDDPDEETYVPYDNQGYAHFSLDHPDLIPDYERHNNGLATKTDPYEDEYGLVRYPSKMEADYDDLLDNIEFRDYGYHATPDTDHINDIYRLAREREEIPDLAQATESYGEKQQENFDEWMHMNDQYTPHYPDPDDPHGWENEHGEGVSEGQGRPYWIPERTEGERYYDHAEAEKAYDDAYGEWEREHPGMSATNQLYSLISPHYDPQQQQYVNEPVQQGQPNAT